jgi:hypothetical protein
MLCLFTSQVFLLRTEHGCLKLVGRVFINYNNPFLTSKGVIISLKLGRVGLSSAIHQFVFSLGTILGGLLPRPRTILSITHGIHKAAGIVLHFHGPLEIAFLGLCEHTGRLLYEIVSSCYLR